MKRILFVDDESRILSGIRRMLHSKRSEWDLVFVEDPCAAAELLSDGKFDVVVSDMRMPGMNGAELLGHAQAKVPAATRIILSGQCDRDNTLQAVPVAHQFLSKPCSAEVLIGAITAALETTSLLEEDAIGALAGSSTSLPSPPRVYQKLVQLVSRDDTRIEDVAAVLRSDAALCAKTLQIVNSSFFGLGAKTTEVGRAVSYLGFRTVRQVVLGAEVFRSFDASRLAPSVDLEAARRHALAVAEVASRLVSNPADVESAYTSGVLHDLGELLLAMRPTGGREPMLDTCRATWTAQELPRHPLHARAGAYLAGQWGLPRLIVEAILHHHRPASPTSEGVGVAEAVAVADGLCMAVTEERGAERDFSLKRLRENHLEPLGLLEREAELLDEAEKRVASVSQG